MIVYIIVIYMNYSSCKIIFFLSEKRKKSKNLHSLPVFLLKNYKRTRFMIPKKRKKMTLQNARSSYLLKFRMWFKNGLKAQKLLAQGNRPGYNSSQQSALKGQKLYKLSGI